MTNNSNSTVRCPTCKKTTLYSKDNPHRPFCSERCKLIDLGAWADEQYRLPLQAPMIESEFEHEDSSKSVENNPDFLENTRKPLKD